MNKSNFNQTGGYPLTTERLQELQTAHEIFNSFGSLAGNYTIISGCNLIGSIVQNGFVFINGELLEFRQAAVTPTSTVIIIETPVMKSFENGNQKQVHTIRYATFGTAEVSWPWSSFRRPIETKEIAPVLDQKADKVTTDNLQANKVDKSVLTLLDNRVKVLEGLLTASGAPIIKIDYASEQTVTSNAGGNGFNDYTRNYVYVYPPFGYTMQHLKGFLASMAEIKYNGDVDSNDSLWCKHRTDSSKVTVICGGSEVREAVKVNYLAIWIK
ncbi:hypothetical protein [Flavobacterium panacagri]|uniref:hypothetical protein n=1 Tax=Flavobacterium panacagri TaxID=3034146 RepID=UPI0025A5E8AF|nr:hypothetical protein [Flavobacterium panacagri]